MAPSTLSARGFMRGRNLPANKRKKNVINVINRESRAAAALARKTATLILGKVGLPWGQYEATALTGDRLLSYMKAAAVTKPHGFLPGTDVTYKSIHPTKGYRFVPA